MRVNLPIWVAPDRQAWIELGCSLGFEAKGPGRHHVERRFDNLGGLSRGLAARSCLSVASLQTNGSFAATAVVRLLTLRSMERGGIKPRC